MQNLKKLGTNVFLWQQCSYFLSFGRSILLMRLLAPDVFGTFALAMTLASWISILRAFDFRTIVIASRDLKEGILENQYTAEVALCFLNLAVGFLLLPWLGLRYQTPVLVMMVCLLAVDCIDGLASTPTYLTERNLKFDFISRCKAVISFFSIVISLYMAWKGLGVWALFADRVITSTVMLVIMWRKTEWRASLAFSPEVLKGFIKFGGVLFIGANFGKILFGYDQFALGTFWNIESLGHYSRALVWARLPMDVGSGFLSLMALALYSAGIRNSAAQTAKTYDQLTFNIACITMWMTGMMALLLKDAVPILFGKSWDAMVPYFLMLIPYAVGRPLFQNASQCLTSLHQQNYFVVVAIILSFLELLLVTACIRFPPMWVGMASGIVMALGYLVLDRQVMRQLQISSWQIIIGPLSVLMTALLCYFLIERASMKTEARLASLVLVSILYTAIFYKIWSSRSALESKNDKS